MYRKQSVFASMSQSVAAKTEADFRGGMIPNTVAMAEDVNAYGMNSDKMNWTMSQELCNLIEAYGVTLGSDYVSDPANAQNKMLLKVLQEKVQTTRCLTGVTVKNGNIPNITQSGSYIYVPQMEVRFNQDVYYSSTEKTVPAVTIPATTVAASLSWATGVYYLYATSAGAIAYQRTPVLGSEGATKCFLGSFFVYNGAIQSGSWKYQPWLQVSAVEDRENPTAYTKGGYMSPASSSTLQMGALEIQAEGMNVSSSVYQPNIKTIQAISPFTYKALYPGYNPGNYAISTIGGTGTYDVGTHLYDRTNSQWVSVKSWASGFNTPRYMVIVPCITPSGQTLMIPAMSTYDSGTNSYSAVFESQSAAAEAVFGLQYPDLTSIASRVIYLGVSLVIRISTTSSQLDLTNPEDFMVVGRVPQQLAGFTSAAGQSGGGTGAYIPMKTYEFDSSYQTVSAMNNAVNIIAGHSTTAVQVNMPSATSGIMNQVMIQYSHTSSNRGLTLPGVTWWFSRQPSFQSGYTYEIIADYVNGRWYAGFMVSATAA